MRLIKEKCKKTKDNQRGGKKWERKRKKTSNIFYE